MTSLTLTASRPAWMQVALNVSCGFLLLTVASQAAIPLQPVPLTLQTMALFLIAARLGGRQAFAVHILYLIAATAGLPILAGGVCNPLWLLKPTAGYLIAFPPAAYLVGRLVERRPTDSVVWLTLAMICGQLLLTLIGVGWLAAYIGLKRACLLGLLPVIPGATLKIGLAAHIEALSRRFS